MRISSDKWSFKCDRKKQAEKKNTISNNVQDQFEWRKTRETDLVTAGLWTRV